MLASIFEGTLGVFVLPLTLYATTYSGVTIVGLPSDGAAHGFYACVLEVVFIKMRGFHFLTSLRAYFRRDRDIMFIFSE